MPTMMVDLIYCVMKKVQHSRNTTTKLLNYKMLYFYTINEKKPIIYKNTIINF